MPKPFFEQNSISDLHDLAPADLLRDPRHRGSMPRADAAVRALKYSRNGDSLSYDERAFRHFAATPTGSRVPLQTIARMRLEQAQAEKQMAQTELLRALDQL